MVLADYVTVFYCEKHMAALSEQAKENKRRRTREWYRKAKAAGTLKPKIRKRRQLTEEGRVKARMCDKRYTESKGPSFWSWRAMLKRCLNTTHKDYHIYGGRGVTVCESWMRFENFLADMGQRPDGLTLDRIDPYGNYEPQNCRWATPKEQAANKRANHKGISDRPIRTG